MRESPVLASHHWCGSVLTTRERHPRGPRPALWNPSLPLDTGPPRWSFPARGLWHREAERVISQGHGDLGRRQISAGARPVLREQLPETVSLDKEPLGENKHQDMTVNTKCAWHFTARCAIPRSRCAWSSRSAPGVVLGSAAEMAKHALGAGPRREASGPTFSVHDRLGRKVLSSTPTLQVANCVPQMEGTERGRRPGPGIWVPTRPALP